MRSAIAAAIVAILVAACDQSTPSTATAAECMVPAEAWCDANYRCDRDRDQLQRCRARARDACAAWAPTGADAAACASLQDDLACSDFSLVNDPESASCLREFWRF